MKTKLTLAIIATITLTSCITLDEREDFTDADVPFGYTQAEQNEMRDPNYGLPIHTIYNTWDDVCINVTSKDTTDKKPSVQKGINVVHPIFLIPINAEE